MLPEPVPRRTHRVPAADGTPLHVDEYGPADSAVTLVLAHGWTLDRRTWCHQIAALADRVRIVAYDHRGHGYSAGATAATATIARVADDLAAVVRWIDGPVVVAGHSLGGMAIMALAEQHPELFAARVAGAAFVNTSSGALGGRTYRLPAPLARLARRPEALIFELIALGGARPLGRTSLLGPGLRWLLFGRSFDPAALRLAVEQVAGTPRASVGGFHATFLQHERTAALAALAGRPVLVMGGQRDRLTPVAHARRIADELPHAEVYVSPRAGHMLPVEEPAEVTRRLADLVRAAATGTWPDGEGAAGRYSG